MRVLLTCAGRRNYLVDYFRDALDGDGQVLAADASPDAPALQAADESFLVAPVDRPGATEALVDLCRAQRVDLLVSLNDYELPFLADERERFRDVGTVAAVSSREVIDLCFDKWATAQFLASCGLDTPRTYVTVDDARRAVAAGEVDYPLVVKPRWGTASIGIEIAADDAELELVFEVGRRRMARMDRPGRPGLGTDGLIIQERLTGQEHGADVVNDLAGRHAATLVRRKVTMRAGETDRAETVSAPAVEDVAEVVARSLGHVGNLDCDIFVEDDRVTVLEMNPRFGGGYPFSHAAGANVPAALVAWAAGREPDPAWLTQRPGVRSSKYDQLVVTP